MGGDGSVDEGNEACLLVSEEAGVFTVRTREDSNFSRDDLRKKDAVGETIILLRRRLPTASFNCV